jgi:hypothetical protein
MEFCGNPQKFANSSDRPGNNKSELVLDRSLTVKHIYELAKLNLYMKIFVLIPLDSTPWQ